MEEHIINLDYPPKKRWEFLLNYKEEINALLQCYLNDFEEADFIFENVKEYKELFISQEYLEEIDFIASITDFSSDQVLIANLYYDILKFYFGCTAFAVNTEYGMLHSRNLDWHTDNELLSKHSKIFDFQRNGKTIFKSVGWVGFIGVLSGIKPCKFSLTLNAVLSDDSPEIAAPVSFLLRDVLSTCDSFQEAKGKLENINIMSDCLILLSGIEKGDKVVIEKTPKRFQTRETNKNHIIVTNDYKLIRNNLSPDNGILQATSCGRYNRAEELVLKEKPQSIQDCLNILKDDKVMMGITVQQMVFNNTTGEIRLIKTSD